MTRDGLQHELDELAADVEEMADLVLDRLGLALDALAEGDETGARVVHDGDDVVNEQYLDIERRCIDLVALRQPVAGDLRFVAASFKIITDLERIADLAANLASYALAADRELFSEVNLADIGDLATGMVEDAVAAYVRRDDGWLCHEVADRDNELDALCSHASNVVVRALIEHEATDDERDDAAIEAFMQDVSVLFLTLRDLERVGDHAVNVAARTLYMTTGSDELIY
ncbi:phosphate signaling complex protein PhoU [Halomarina pelagica]|uniref:phosphate signaling complex protein PhoU n=1 Tax=Halomarina pelagica TaxID=2961599 RepID=UPI0020C5A811|nr:phosphate signaling complex protein PhoU [Halomarina sp. BND7]